MPNSAVPAVLDHIDATLDAARERLFALLRIPGVSAQPNHDADCAASAMWLSNELEAIGFAVDVLPTAGHPVLLARMAGPAGAPHLLYYGHYDVQPAEPLELWTHPPFDPQLVDGPRGKRIVARGAVDDKGQAMMIVAALRAWREAHGSIPVGCTVLIEGEEEIGSLNLEPFLETYKDRLGADVAVISDTTMWDIDTPALTTRLRGLTFLEVTLRGPSRDLHSGMYGGSALNPLNALARILGELHDDQGRIRLPGFYDGVREISPAQAAQWEGLRFDEGAYLHAIGLAAPAGEADRPALQRLWSRPTADINGLWGGYTGVGAKTVIASEASAKISFRLVPDQDPQEVAQQFRRFVTERLPKGASAAFQILAAGPGIAINEESVFMRAAAAVLEEEFSRAPVMMGCGGSIPVVESLRRILGIDSVLMGFGLDDDQPHSPNEKFELRCFHRGIRSHARLIGRLAGLG